MRWVKSCLCFLLAEVRLQWVRSLKVLLDWYLRVRGKSMNSNSREKLEQTIIGLDSKITWLKMVIQSLLVLLAGWLHAAAPLLCVVVSSCQHAGPQSSGRVSQTPAEKEGPSGYSDSSPTLQVKTRSPSLWDTSPIWAKPHSVGSSGFTLGLPQDNEH